MFNILLIERNSTFALITLENVLFYVLILIIIKIFIITPEDANALIFSPWKLLYFVL